MFGENSGLGALFQPVWAKLPDLLRHLGCFQGKLRSHGSGYVDHFHALTFQPDLLDLFLNKLNSSSGLEITFQVMAVAGQSACHQNTIRTILQGL
jgi:hypothetical protein